MCYKFFLVLFLNFIYVLMYVELYYKNYVQMYKKERRVTRKKNYNKRVDIDEEIFKTPPLRCLVAFRCFLVIN